MTDKQIIQLIASIVYNLGFIILLGIYLLIWANNMTKLLSYDENGKLKKL